MKKIIAILSVVFATSAVAGGAGITTEFELENGKNGGSDSKSLSLAPYYKFDNGIKADVKVESGRDDGSVAGENHAIESKVEARVRKDFSLTPKASVGIRVGIGEVLAAQDFSYYTIEPIATYKVSQNLSLNTSYRYRNSFNSEYAFKTNTAKVGVAYKVTPEDEFGLKYFEKRGDSRSDGFEFVYTRGF